MHKRLSMLPLLSLLAAGCGGATLDLSLTSDDASENFASPIQVSALVAAADLTGVRSVTVTVREVWVHLADDKDKDKATFDGASILDTDGGWERISSEAHTVDLMTLRAGDTQSLGVVDVPAGTLSQVRLALEAPAGADASGKVRLTGAVTEMDGTVCDLLIPQSAMHPGIKVDGVLKAMKLEAGGKHAAVLNLKLKESQKLADAACTYELNPVLKVKKFETLAK